MKSDMGKLRGLRLPMPPCDAAAATIRAMDLITEITLVCVAMPAAVAALALLLAPRHGDNIVRGAIATGGAFLLVMLVLPWVSLAPQRAWQWLGYLAAGAGVVSALGGKHWLAHIAGVLTCVAAGWLLVPEYPKTADSIVLYRVAVGVTVGLVWWALEHMADHTEPTPTGWLWLTIALAGAALCERAGIAKFIQLQTAMAASLGVIALVGVFKPLGRSLRGAAGPFAVVLVGLAVNAWIETFLGVPLVSFLLLVLTPMALGVTAIGRWSKQPVRKMMWIRVTITGVMLAAAVGLAWAA